LLKLGKSFYFTGVNLLYTQTLSIANFDPALWEAMQAEAKRQEVHIELIASENYTSPRVLAAQGSVLTNKYAEGYSGRRYYGGCEYIDQVENLAIERAKQLFGAHYVNVQPHSGSQANAAVFMALLQPGDSLLGMDLAHGGHLTHGASVSFSGKLYQAVSYGVNQEGLIDYAAVERLAWQHKPKLIIAGFSAYSRIVDWQRFRQIADSVGAWLMVDMAHVAGLVAAGVYPSPLPFAHVVTTTTHKTLRGPRGGLILTADAEFAKRYRLDSAIFPGSQGGPLMHVIAAKAVAFQEAMQPQFKNYQTQTLKNARTMVEILQSHGFNILSGGTDNHLFLIDLRNQAVTGLEAEGILEKASITLNKNLLPYDPRPAKITSGLRVGTPAVTTRGFKEPEVKQVAQWIAEILKSLNADKKLAMQAVAKIKSDAQTLCEAFPVYL
jgi:glycine hydroxymethyltransferase